MNGHNDGVALNTTDCGLAHQSAQKQLVIYHKINTAPAKSLALSENSFFIAVLHISNIWPPRPNSAMNGENFDEHENVEIVAF